MVPPTCSIVLLPGGPRLGWVSRDAKEGDLISVFEGVGFPYILRKVGEERRGTRSFVMIGRCHVSDIMRGEAVNDPNLGVTDVKLP